MPPPKLSLQFGADKRHCFVDVRIARSANGNIDIFLRSELLQGAFEGEILHEFAFSILVVGDENGEPPFETQMREIATRYIPPEIRRDIMPIVCDSLAMLLSFVNPRRLYRVTKSAGLPAKALAKHEMLSQACVKAGYRIVDSGIDPMGRNYWDMLRT